MAKKNNYSPEISRFVEFRKSMGLNQQDIARVLEVQRSNISNIETGRVRLTKSHLAILEKEYNLNPEWLVNGIPPMILAKQSLNKQSIPIIADIPAGPWEYWYDSYLPGGGEDYISVPGVQGMNLFGIKVQGDSMEPALYEGDIIIIDPHKQFQRGMAVVRYREGYKITNVQEKPNNMLHIWPQNPAHQEEVIMHDEDTRLYVPIKVISMRDI